MSAEYDSHLLEIRTIEGALKSVQSTQEYLAPIVFLNLRAYQHRVLHGREPKQRVVSDSQTVRELGLLVIDKGGDRRQGGTYTPMVAMDGTGFYSIPYKFFHEVFANHEHYASGVIMPAWAEREPILQHKWLDLALEAISAINKHAEEIGLHSETQPVTLAI